MSGTGRGKKAGRYSRKSVFGGRSETGRVGSRQAEAYKCWKDSHTAEKHLAQNESKSELKCSTDW